MCKYQFLLISVLLFPYDKKYLLYSRILLQKVRRVDFTKKHCDSHGFNAIDIKSV